MSWIFEFIGKCFLLVKTTFQKQGIIISPTAPARRENCLLSNDLQELNGKEKEMLENEMKEKIKNREAGISKAKKIKNDLKI